jgi:hypothetical protein
MRTMIGDPAAWNVREHPADVDLAQIHPQAARLDPGRVEEIVDQAAQALTLVEGLIEHLGRPLGREPGRPPRSCNVRGNGGCVLSGRGYAPLHGVRLTTG